MEKDNNITKEILLLYKLYEVAENGYFIETYKRNGVKISEGTQTDIRLEIGYDKSSGYIDGFIRKWINLGILKFVHNDNIRGRIIPLYKPSKEKIREYLLRIPVFKGAVKLIKKESIAILGSKFEEEIEDE